MTTRTIFAEHAQRASREYAPGRRPAAVMSAWRGMCAESCRDTELHHFFADGDEMLADRSALRGLPRASADLFGEALDAAFPDDADVVDAALAPQAVNGLELTWSRYWQRAAVGKRGRAVADTRSLSSVELRLRSADGPALTVAVPWCQANPAASGELVGQAAEELRCYAALPTASLPPDPCAVVLDAGHAGAFFHELVGHPLEADVVAGQSSYLASLTGKQVAPAWFSVWDGTGSSDGGVQACVDDEGTAVRPVMIISHGRVSAALSDASTAPLLGMSSSGHGRRLNYRHCVLPRMRHTVAADDVGTEAEPTCAGRPRLRLRGLQLRWMNLLTGEFQFAVSGALLEASGRAFRVGPFLLGGHGTDVLAALRSQGTAVKTCGSRATKGCGKLNQFPLPVSFANGSLWFPGEVVRVSAS